MSSKKREPQIFLEDDILKKYFNPSKFSYKGLNKKVPVPYTLNQKELTRKFRVRKINEALRKRQNERREDMKKIKKFMKQGFEQSYELLTSKIRISQEVILAESAAKYYALEGGMSDLNRNMKLMDENNKNNAKTLQYRIMFVQKQIDHLREQTLLWIKQLDTANQKRQEQILKYIEQLSEQAVKLAQQLSDQLGETEKHLSEGIINVSKQIVELHKMIISKFGSLENFIKAQGQEIRTDVSTSFRRLDTKIDDLMAMISRVSTSNPPAQLYRPGPGYSY